jgi:hypothetical protein
MLIDSFIKLVTRIIELIFCRRSSLLNVTMFSLYDEALTKIICW